MSAIEDIVDLAKDLESRAKDRRDIEVLRQIHSLAFSLQSEHAEIVERDFRLMQENAELKRQLADTQAEEIRIHHMVEFRRGSRTGNKWMPFCPKCKMPAADDWMTRGSMPNAFCSAYCGWSVLLPMSLDEVARELTNEAGG